MFWVEGLGFEVYEFIWVCELCGLRGLGQRGKGAGCSVLGYGMGFWASGSTLGKTKTRIQWT